MRCVKQCSIVFDFSGFSLFFKNFDFQMTWLENATSISTLGHRSPSDGHDARDAVRLKTSILNTIENES